MNIELETTPSGLLFSEIEDERPTVSLWVVYWACLCVVATIFSIGCGEMLPDHYILSMFMGGIGDFFIGTWFGSNFDSHTGHMRMERVL